MPDLHQTLSRLIAMPTVSNRPTTEISAFLAQLAEDQGFSVSLQQNGPDKANVIARMGPRDTEGLLISGHMDVVPTEGQDWSVDPYALTEKNGVWMGRGTCDMKGFVAAVMVATAGLPALEHELVLVWTHDEEVGCQGSAKLLEHWQGPVPKQAWIGEPTGLKVGHSHPGHTTLRLTFEGIPAHTSKPHLGRNAFWAMRDALSTLQVLGQDFPDFKLVPAMVSGGTATNIVPDHATLMVGLRCPPGQDKGALIQAITDGVDGSVDLLQDARPMCSSPSTLTSTIGTGVVQIPFTTDGGNLAELGTAPVICGPGSIDMAHRPDESVSIDALKQTVTLAKRVITHFCV